MLFSVMLCISSIFFVRTEEISNNLNILMPDVVASHTDEYLCASFPLDKTKEIYITAFSPSATSKDAHHMLLYGCTQPGSQQKIWNCEEMANKDGKSAKGYETGPTCASGSMIIHAWAMDAKKFELPKDVAFKVGGSTSIQTLVLQVHYANIDKFKAGETDRSGLILTTTSIPTLKLAGVYLLLTGGQINANSEEVFEVACKIEQDIVIHPFAFRTHTHKLGLVNSGYRVRGEDDEQIWTEIGRRSPQLPQMFYPINKNVTIKQGDSIAAVCTMFNRRSDIVRIGPTGDDEMCNFYMMYWVNGNQLLDDAYCRSMGPPYYYFRNDPHLNTNKIPANAFRIPPSNESRHDVNHSMIHRNEKSSQSPMHKRHLH